MNDLEDIDSDFTKSLRWVLENSIEGLEQTFTYETTTFGKHVRRDLVSNGDEILVTDENKEEFVDRICEMKTRGEFNEELEAFLRGFNLIVPSLLVSMFSPSELQLVIAGESSINVGEMKQYAKYGGGYNKDDEVIKWLWEIFEEFSQKELTAFIFFVTGFINSNMGY